MQKRILALSPLALLASCATTAATGLSALAGSEWQFTAIDGTAADGTLSFQSDRLIANAGCNRMGGTWRTDGGRLVVGPLMGTKMFCEGKMAQETAIGALLEVGPELTLSGDRLSLKSTAHSADLKRVR